MLAAVFAGVACAGILWAGAAITAVLSGHAVPEVNPATGLLALAEHGGIRPLPGGQRSAPPGCIGPRPLR
jgi:hypothetical protein